MPMMRLGMTGTCRPGYLDAYRYLPTYRPTPERQIPCPPLPCPALLCLCDGRHGTDTGAPGLTGSLLASLPACLLTPSVPRRPSPPSELPAVSRRGEAGHSPHWARKSIPRSRSLSLVSKAPLFLARLLFFCSRRDWRARHPSLCEPTADLIAAPTADWAPSHAYRGSGSGPVPLVWSGPRLGQERKQEPARRPVCGLPSVRWCPTGSDSRTCTCPTGR